MASRVLPTKLLSNVSILTNNSPRTPRARIRSFSTVSRSNLCKKTSNKQFNKFRSASCPIVQHYCCSYSTSTFSPPNSKKPDEIKTIREEASKLFHKTSSIKEYNSQYTLDAAKPKEEKEDNQSGFNVYEHFKKLQAYEESRLCRHLQPNNIRPYGSQDSLYFPSALNPSKKWTDNTEQFKFNKSSHSETISNQDPVQKRQYSSKNKTVYDNIKDYKDVNLIKSKEHLPTVKNVEYVPRFFVGSANYLESKLNNKISQLLKAPTKEKQNLAQTKNILNKSKIISNNENSEKVKSLKNLNWQERLEKLSGNKNIFELDYKRVNNVEHSLNTQLANKCNFGIDLQSNIRETEKPVKKCKKFGVVSKPSYSEFIKAKSTLIDNIKENTLSFRASPVTQHSRGLVTYGLQKLYENSTKNTENKDIDVKITTSGVTFSHVFTNENTPISKRLFGTKPNSIKFVEKQQKKLPRLKENDCFHKPDLILPKPPEPLEPLEKLYDPVDPPRICTVQESLNIKRLDEDLKICPKTLPELKDSMCPPNKQIIPKPLEPLRKLKMKFPDEGRPRCIVSPNICEITPRSDIDDWEYVGDKYVKDSNLKATLTTQKGRGSKVFKRKLSTNSFNMIPKLQVQNQKSSCGKHRTISSSYVPLFGKCSSKGGKCKSSRDGNDHCGGNNKQDIKLSPKELKKREYGLDGKHAYKKDHATTRHLEPQNKILNPLETLQPPYPTHEHVSPVPEDTCIRSKHGLKQKGLTVTCKDSKKKKEFLRLGKKKRETSDGSGKSTVTPATFKDCDKSNDRKFSTNSFPPILKNLKREMQKPCQKSFSRSLKLEGIDNCIGTKKKFVNEKLKNHLEIYTAIPQDNNIQSKSQVNFKSINSSCPYPDYYSSNQGVSVMYSTSQTKKDYQMIMRRNFRKDSKSSTNNEGEIIKTCKSDNSQKDCCNPIIKTVDTCKPKKNLPSCELPNVCCKSSCSDTKGKVQFECPKFSNPCEHMTGRTPKLSLWKRFVNYFKARSNCPTPVDYKRKKLKAKATAAAKKAGLCLYDPKEVSVQISKKKRKGHRCLHTYSGKRVENFGNFLTHCKGPVVFQTQRLFSDWRKPYEFYELDEENSYCGYQKCSCKDSFICLNNTLDILKNSKYINLDLIYFQLYKQLTYRNLDMCLDSTEKYIDQKRVHDLNAFRIFCKNLEIYLAKNACEDCDSTEKILNELDSLMTYRINYQ